ncbi:hypothetical protein F4860DRAFT_515317 [Xylaria cubensis]|nr:hypothetical protein F4860DRAFT_515317 [Xylaria cubensis]
MALRRYQLAPDAGHDNAIRHIYNKIVEVASAIQRQNCLYTEEPKPTNPLPRSSDGPGNSGQASRDKRSTESEYNEDFPFNRASWLDLRKESHAYFICDVPYRSAEAYFFYKKDYVLINMAEDRIVNGPKVIANEWPSLRSSNFFSVDAVLPTVIRAHTNEGYELVAENEAYFFCGKSYSLIKVEPGTNNDEIVNGPKLISTEWPSLHESSFSTVDSSVMIPKSDPEAYFFNGADYCRIKIARGTNDDSIVVGRRAVWENWPPLADAFFY